MKNEIVRSPLFYVGDKYKLMSEIKAHFPKQIHNFYEPFVGGGSVFLNIEADKYFLNDINPYVIALHKMLCSFIGKESHFFQEMANIIHSYNLSFSLTKDIIPKELKQAYPKLYFAKFNKEGYKKLRSDFNSSDKSNMEMLYILLIYGFNRMLRFNNKGDFNIPVGNVDFNKNTEQALLNYFERLRLKNIYWSHIDFREFLSQQHYEENDLVYLDPPYLITFSEYNKLWNESIEQELLEILNELNIRQIRFAISNVTHYKGKTNSLFLNWAENYNIHPIKSNYISYHDNSIKQFNEVLVTNF